MNLPNKITTFRMVMVVFILTIMLIPYNFFGINVPMLFGGRLSLIHLISFCLFVIASISDFVDGYIARKYNLITNYGKFMDPIADKMLVNSLLIVLLVKPGFAGHMTIPVVLVVIMIARDLVVDGLRLVAAEKKTVMAANIFGKLKTVLQMVAISVVLLNDLPFSLMYEGSSIKYVSLALLTLAALASFVSGVIYLVQNGHVLKEKK